MKAAPLIKALLLLIVRPVSTAAYFCCSITVRVMLSQSVCGTQHTYLPTDVKSKAIFQIMRYMYMSNSLAGN